MPICEKPNFGTIQLHGDSWYAGRGYAPSGSLVHNLKVYSTNSYVSTVYRATSTNVVIVSGGDITITGLGGQGLTGVLLAPYGKVTFGGQFFTGTVLARDGFDILNNAAVRFENLENYFPNPQEYPFWVEY